MSIDYLTRKGHRTRAAILAAAKEVFAERGYVGTRMSDIADRASISHGAVYRYFSDKDSVFAELFEETHREFYEATRSGRLLAVDPYAAIRTANLRFFEAYERNRGFMAAIVEASAVNSRYMTRWAGMFEETANRFLRRLKARSGSSENDRDLELTVLSLVCMTQQAAYFNYAQRSDGARVSTEELADTISRIWLKALFSDQQTPAGASGAGNGVAV